MKCMTVRESKKKKNERAAHQTLGPTLPHSSHLGSATKNAAIAVLLHSIDACHCL